MAGSIDAKPWPEIAGAIERAAEIVAQIDAPDTPRFEAEAERYVARFLAAGLVSCVLHNDPEHPVFGRMMDYTMPWGLDHPDCLYLYAPLAGDGVYRVRGPRGSANHFDVQVNAGHFALGSVAATETVASADARALELGDGDVLDLQIGGRAGETGAAHWLPSREDAGFLLVRQYFGDWEHERPADLFIEREDATWPIPPPTPERVRAQLALLETWLVKGAEQWAQMSAGFLSLPENSVITHAADRAAKNAGAADQSYCMGNFACGADEAVIVSFVPPASHHWVFAMGNRYWEQIEFASRQSSLNHAQAQVDDDGVFRAVIAHSDPGVPNWLDPASDTRGTVAMRFLGADEAPTPAFERVPFAGLREHLPASTPRVTPEARAEALRRRYRAVVTRYRR
ncbi:MAG: hypothetical protein NXI30_07930 [bacterium]|nr:hypothetical protein [bacterium]